MPLFDTQGALLKDVEPSLGFLEPARLRFLAENLLKNTDPNLMFNPSNPRPYLVNYDARLLAEWLLDLVNNYQCDCRNHGAVMKLKQKQQAATMMNNPPHSV